MIQTTQAVEKPQILLESVGRCALCESTESDVVFEAVEDYLCGVQGSFRYVQCRGCGLVYQDPRPAISSLIDCYVEYHTHETRELPSSFTGEWQGASKWIRGGILSAKYGYRHLAPATTQTVVATVLDIVPQIRSRARCGLGTGRCSGLPAFRGKGRALDIGTGAGIYAATLARLGWKMTCVEFDEVTAANTSKRLNLNVFTGSVEDAGFEPNSFDFVSMFHVIEHLTDPVATLRECHRVMEDGASMMIRTPNFDSLVRKAFGQYWRGVEAPRHLYLFNPDSLQRAVELAGFKVTSVCTSRAATPYYLKTSREMRSRATGKEDSPLISSVQDKAFSLIAKASSYLGLTLGDEMQLEAVK